MGAATAGLSPLPRCCANLLCQLVMLSAEINRQKSCVLHLLLSVPTQPQSRCRVGPVSHCYDDLLWRMDPMNHNLADGFYESSLQFPGNLALSVGGCEFSYSQLREFARPVAGWLRRNTVDAAPRVGILASRSLATYTGILGTCRAGGTYVAAVVDSSLEFLPDGQQGELLVAGPQLSSGYFGAEDLTRASFPVLQGKRWYRTGDLACRDSFGTFHHLGRIDNQIKVRGQRVELEEVESHLRETYGTGAVAAVAWPVDHGSAYGIVAFVSGQTGEDEPEVKSKIKSRLPSYMVPSTIYRVESLPLNAHGKVDRKELVTLLDEGEF